MRLRGLKERNPGKRHQVRPGLAGRRYSAKADKLKFAKQNPSTLVWDVRTTSGTAIVWAAVGRAGGREEKTADKEVKSKPSGGSSRDCWHWLTFSRITTVNSQPREPSDSRVNPHSVFRI